MAKPEPVKRNFLSKLHINGVYFIISALILLLGAPLYQLFVLVPQSYSAALAALSSGHFSSYLVWIADHRMQFLIYRLLLIIAFACLLNMPFTLFRIIVAQEILGREEEEKNEPGSVPDLTWRGKGFAVLAAWAGLFGILLTVLGTLIGTLYFYAVGTQFIVPTLADAFTIIIDTLGGGLLALASLLFGATIVTSGRNLWPGIWVAFGYLALPIAAFFSASAVAVASAPNNQALFTTLAVLLFALWILWFGIMLVRLQPE